MRNEKLIDNIPIFVKLTENIDKDFLEIFKEVEVIKKNPFDKKTIEKIFKYIRFFRGIFEILGFIYLSKVSEIYEKTIENILYERENDLNESLSQYIDEGIEKLYKITRTKVYENYSML